MKQMNIKQLLIFPLLAVTISGCVNGDDYNTPDLSQECTSLTVTKQVQDITAMSTATYQQYPDADIIEAYVTSSDEGGNFYKSISLVSVDGTTGFSMPIDAYNLYTKFEPGRKVYVNMEDRYFVTENNSTVIGSLYYNNTPADPSDDEVGRISGVEYQNVLKRSCDKVDEDDIVKHLTISQAKNNQNLNMLIEFDAVQFTDASVGKKYFDPTVNNLGGATNHLITDEFGNTIILRVSEFATFAQHSITNKSGKIRGVLTKFGSDFQFMVRTENDINLTNDHLTIDMSPPIGGTAITYSGAFTENFESYTAGTITTGQRIFPKYVNDPYLGTKYWYVESFSSNKYLKMTAFSTSTTTQDQNNKTYFIVPVDFTAANSMSFKTQDRFNVGAVLKVYYSTNYVPVTNIGNATLTDITSNFTIATGTTGSASLPFVSSGVYNFPAGLTGNGFVIFEYTGGYSFNPDLTTTMHIDDIVIN
jgi:uncharacterized protein DUF5689